MPFSRLMSFLTVNMTDQNVQAKSCNDPGFPARAQSAGAKNSNNAASGNGSNGGGNGAGGDGKGGK